MGTVTAQIEYVYDENGSPIGCIWNGSTYFYQKNLQGDVISIVDPSCNIVVSYSYDAWGNLLSITGTNAATLGVLNSIRYRSYYYDTETGFYYLNSRYYDPQVTRFLNADGIIGANGGILGFNMYAYCSNNPIMYSDPNGQNAEALQWWTGTMWWLCGVDAVLPIGDIIYCATAVAIGYIAIRTAEAITETCEAEKEAEKDSVDKLPREIYIYIDMVLQLKDLLRWFLRN